MSGLDIFYISFSKLLGDGRAWFIRALNIKNVIESCLSILVPIRTLYFRIGNIPFPTQNGGFFPDDVKSDEDLEVDIKNFELQFDIADVGLATLSERAAFVEVQWGLIGAQSAGYIQFILNSAGIDVYVKENIPEVDLGAYVGNQYNEIQYGQKQYGPVGLNLLGNGKINIDGEFIDPVNLPITNYWNYLFIVEGVNYLERIDLSTSQYNILIKLLLKIKPAHTVAWLNINPT